MSALLRTLYDAGSYRIRKGWVNAVELTEAYQITSFAKQTDQGKSDWLIPVNESSVYNQAAENVRALGGGARFNGRANFVWELNGLSPGMMLFLKDDATMFEGKASEQFTVETWDRQGLWRIVWAWGYWDIASNAGTPGYLRGFRAWRIPFVVEQTAPDSPDVAPALSYSDPLTNGMDGDLSLTVENVGDGATFDDVVLQIDLNEELVFVSADGDDFDIEYFEGVSWSDTVSVPADVESVRGTVNSGVLSAGATSTPLVVTVNPSSTGAHDCDIVATTAGDSNASNDTSTEAVNVT
jgi:hypothetical protein